MCGCSQTKTCRYLDHCYCERRFIALLNRRVLLKDTPLCGAWNKPHEFAPHQNGWGLDGPFVCGMTFWMLKMSDCLALCKNSPKITLTFVFFPPIAKQNSWLNREEVGVLTEYQNPFAIQTSWQSHYSCGHSGCRDARCLRDRNYVGNFQNKINKEAIN